MDFSIFAEPAIWASLVTLTLMEIVLGIDNIVFISLLANKLPVAQRKRARNIGLMLAVAFRIVLLLFVSSLVALVNPLFVLPLDFLFPEDMSPEKLKTILEVSGRDIILFIGGLFLVAKATSEINGALEGFNESKKSPAVSTFQYIILQIVLLDIVFSIDSILTAVGLVDEVLIMIIAVLLSLAIMLQFAGRISDYIHKHPSLKILALSFLLLIGFLLLVESFGMHVPKGYVYTAMAFSVFVEFLNIRSRKKKKPVDLHQPEFDSRNKK
jgi:predicted tellurium resistance membrane protein TerC